MKLSHIKPNPNNPRQITADAVQKLAESISRDPEFMALRPIVVDGDNMIVGGNQRYRAIKQLGMKEIPDEWVIKADSLTDEQRRRFVLVDNSIPGMSGDWDVDLLANEWELPELQELGFDLESLGLDAFDGEPDGEGLTGEDEVPEAPEEAKTKPGDLYQLGDHWLLCGDATKQEDVERLMGGERADMVFTDPPYGVQRDKGFGGAGGFGGDGKPIARRKYSDNWDAERPDGNTFKTMLSVSRFAIIFGGNYFADLLPQGKHWIVWDKKNTMPTFGDCELAWTNIDRDSVKIKEFQYNGLIGKEKERFHPTQKPVNLFVELLEDYTQKKQIITDIFGGSGTTLIACEKTNRKCYMMEIDPKYCDVIVKRWEDFTGRTAELLATETKGHQ